MTNTKPTFWFKVSNALILLSLLLTLILPWWTGEKDFNIGGYFLVKRTDAVFPWGVFVTIDHFQAYQILFFYKGNNFGSSDDPLAEALLSPYNASGRAFWLFVVFTMVLLSIILLVLGNYKKSPFHLGIATFLLFLASMTFLFAWVGTTGFFP